MIAGARAAAPLPIEHAHAEQRRNVRPWQEDRGDEREHHHGDAVFFGRARNSVIEPIIFPADEIVLLAYKTEKL